MSDTRRSYKNPARRPARRREMARLQQADMIAVVEDGRIKTRMGAHLYDLPPRDMKLIRRAARVLSERITNLSWGEMARRVADSHLFCIRVREYEQLSHMDSRAAIFKAAFECYGPEFLAGGDRRVRT